MSTPTVSRKSRASRCMFTLVPLLSNDPHTARSAHPVSLVTRTNYSILGKAVRSRSRPLCLLDFQSLSLRSSRVTHFSPRRALLLARTRGWLLFSFVSAHVWNCRGATGKSRPAGFFGGWRMVVLLLLGT